MKKSKVIIPALGVILLSTVASVTGTVAWFTMTTAFNTTIGDFAVVKTNDDLACTVSAGVGTTIESNVVKLKTTSSETNYTSQLTDASFNHNYSNGEDTNPKIVAPNNDGTEVASLTNLPTDTTAGAILRKTYEKSSTHYNVYSAVTWKMTFSVKFGEGSNNYGLFMDTNDATNKSQVTLNDDSEVSGDSTAKGFRIAFIPQDNSETTYGNIRIWAPNQTTTNTTYVTNTTINTAFTSSAYSSPTLIASDTTTIDVPTSAAATSTYASTTNFFGKITADAGNEVSLSFICVAWYEGTDPNIVNQASSSAYQTVKAKMNFKIAELSD